MRQQVSKLEYQRANYKFLTGVYSVTDAAQVTISLHRNFTNHIRQGVQKRVSQSHHGAKYKLQTPQSNPIGGKGIGGDRVSVKIQLEELDFMSVNLTIEDILDKQDGGHERGICEQ